MKSKLALADDLIRTRLEEYEEGDRPRDMDDILKIYTALKSERPISDYIMTTILNAMSYLHGDYPLKDPEHFSIIMTFLEAFYQYSRDELLSTAGTYKDGLSMVLPEEDEDA